MKLKVELREPQAEIHEVSEDAVRFTLEDCKAARLREMKDPANFPMYLRRNDHLFTKLIAANEGWEISILNTDMASRVVHSFYGLTSAALEYVSGRAKIVPRSKFDLAYAVYLHHIEKYK